MASSLILRKGFDIKLEGFAKKFIADVPEPAYYALKSTDFPGLDPGLNVKKGDRILAGTPLFNDTSRPEILFTSPVSGTVYDIKKDENNGGLEIVVEKSGDEFLDFGITNPTNATREHIKKILLISGLWPAIRQRPFHIISNPADVPKSVFVSGFDTAPLAPDYNFIIENSSASFLKTGFNVLRKLTDGNVNLVLDGRGQNADAYNDIPEIKISYISGPHPAGNTGVHIHHLDPVSNGQLVWFANLQDVLAIGRLFEQGYYNPQKIIALTGSEVLHPQYYKVRTGASVTNMVKNNMKGGNLRYISGNILTGTEIGPDGYPGFYDSQVTVVSEENYSGLFGRFKPEANKFSFNREFLSKLFHGRKRPSALPGKYDKVLPMNVFPLQLLKAIVAEDIPGMEKLGIYDVAEEDMALYEFIYHTGTDVQSIIRKGINLMIRREPDKLVDKDGSFREKTTVIR